MRTFPGMRAVFLAGVAAASVTVAFAPTSALAQTAERTYSIPQQDLAEALRAFALASGVDVAFDPAVVRGRRSAPLTGRHSAERALQILLGGTGLAVRPTASGGYGVIAASTADAGIGGGVAGEDSAEIIVTAQRRSERLQDAPLSVSVATGAEIDARNVTSLEGLQFSIPGLSIGTTAPGQDVIQIGGVSNANGSATVGVYLDEMALEGNRTQIGSAGTIADVRLIDMARIEVLRGPQGTLYGQGSMGGTIRYITASPNLRAFSGAAEGEIGWVDGGGQSYNVNGVLNLPVVEDQLGVRLVAGYERNGGWIDNTATGDSNINDTEFLTLRGKILARPADGLELSLLYVHQESDLDYQAFAIDGLQSSPVQTFNHDRYDLLNGIVTYDFGPVTVLGTIGYLDRTTRSQFDLSPSFVPFLTAPPPFGFGFPPGFVTEIPFTSRTEQDVLIGELRFSSSGQRRFSWTAGGYYREGNATLTQATSTSPNPLPFVLLSGTIPSNSKSFAFFADGTYRLTDQLSVSVGARYFEERVRFSSNTVIFGAPAAFNPPPATFDSFDPRFNISWRFSPTSMIYASAASGFRSGGFNAIPFAGLEQTFEPDQLWRYEVGTKHQLLGRRLELAGDVYYTEWSNVQTTVLIAGGALAITENSGEVNGWGVDLSVIARPVDGLTLSATYGWNNLEFAEGTTSSTHAPGDPVDFAVRESYSASFDFRRPVFGEATFFFRGDYQHAGEAQQTIRLQGLINRFPARDLVNLRSGLEIGAFEVSAYANNAFNTRRVVVPRTPTFPNDLELSPREIGVNVRARF